MGHQREKSGRFARVFWGGPGGSLEMAIFGVREADFGVFGRVDFWGSGGRFLEKLRHGYHFRILGGGRILGDFDPKNDPKNESKNDPKIDFEVMGYFR